MTKQIERQIEEKILKAIEDNDFSPSGENYAENAILVWTNGAWETTCYNEYGSRYGSMKSGQIALTDEEREHLQSILSKHIVFNY